MVKYKITNLSKRSIIIGGNGVSVNQTIITDKPYKGFKIKCELIEEKLILEPKKTYKKQTIEEVD